MKFFRKLPCVLALSGVLGTVAFAQPVADIGMQAMADITDLATINGQALACQDMRMAQRAKSLMLLHSPKTDRYGSAFTEGTNQSFMAQTRATTACPDTAVLSSQLDLLAKRLQSSLPPKPVASQ